MFHDKLAAACKGLHKASAAGSEQIAVSILLTGLGVQTRYEPHLFDLR